MSEFWVRNIYSLKEQKKTDGIKSYWVIIYKINNLLLSYSPFITFLYSLDKLWSEMHVLFISDMIDNAVFLSEEKIHVFKIIYLQLIWYAI